MFDPDSRLQVIQGDCRTVMADMPNEVVHAIAGDPPYGLAFMGRDWDDFEPREYQSWCEEWASEAIDVLKPGGHLLAFSGSRTHHRLFSGVEDAGFEIRDTLTWHYGNGFPKALDVSKSIDKSAGKLRQELAKTLKREREAAGMSRTEVAEAVGASEASVRDWEEGRRRSADDDDVEWVFPTRDRHKQLSKLFDAYPSPQKMDQVDSERDRRDDGTVLGLGHTGERGEYVDRSDAACEWSGWKTALKPATEFIVLARKPFDGTVAENVQEHDTAALNIEGCRRKGENRPKRVRSNEETGHQDKYGDYDFDTSRSAGTTDEGRYPANVIYDEAAAWALDQNVGELDAGGHPSKRNTTGYSGGLKQGDTGHDRTSTDSGGPSRYFYVHGWDPFAVEWNTRYCYTSKATKAERTLNGKIKNAHPTVKPVDLMEWLTKLVTKPDHLVLDPFAGSGTGGMAAKELGRRWVGIELQEQWANVARARIGLTPDDPSALVESPNQTTLADLADD